MKQPFFLSIEPCYFSPLTLQDEHAEVRLNIISSLDSVIEVIGIQQLRNTLSLIKEKLSLNLAYSYDYTTVKLPKLLLGLCRLM